MRSAGLRVDDVTGKRLTIRLLSLAVRSPGVGLFRKGDVVDRALDAVGLGRFGEIALIRASRPGTSATTEGRTGWSNPAGLLACPTCRGSLGEATDSLACGGCGATYPVVDGLRMLLSSTPSGA
jgi:hypothetical protein